MVGPDWKALTKRIGSQPALTCWDWPLMVRCATCQASDEMFRRMLGREQDGGLLRRRFDSIIHPAP